jgi:hypothetical protein
MNAEDTENTPPSAKRRRKTTSPSRPLSSGTGVNTPGGRAGNHTVALPYASFLSPTKASLARFNPTLLPPPRRRSRSSKSLSPARTEDVAGNRLSYVLGDKLAAVGGTRDNENGEGDEKEQRDPEEIQTDTTPGKGRNGVSDAVNRASVSANATPTAIRNSGLAKSDDVFTPSLTERSKRPLKKANSHTEEEDDLPETPEKMLQQAKNLTPRGILYHSTPRRRKQREAERQKFNAMLEESERADSERSVPASIVEVEKANDTTVKIDSALENAEDESIVMPRVIEYEEQNYNEKDLDEIKRKREEMDTLLKQVTELKGDMRDVRRHLKKIGVHTSGRSYSDLNDLM